MSRPKAPEGYVKEGELRSRLARMAGKRMIDHRKFKKIVQEAGASRTVLPKCRHEVLFDEGAVERIIERYRKKLTIEHNKKGLRIR
jgi:predicted RNase H-like nuclease